MSDDVVRTIEDLEARYGEVPEGATLKETSALTPLQQQWVTASPFVIVATQGETGLDCSPRGDPAPIVHVVNAKTLHLPDRRGNNRLDTLRNLIADPRIGMLFLVPGLGTTIRVNGTAVLRSDPDLRARYPMGASAAWPTTVIEVTVLAAYTQCPKALVRSDLWNPSKFLSPKDLPTVGAIMDEITHGSFGGSAYDAAYPERLRTTIY